MSIDGHVAGSAGQRLPFSVGNMLLGLGIAVLFGHSKINDVNDIGSLGARTTDEEVVGLDVAIDEILFVDCLDP